MVIDAGMRVSWFPLESLTAAIGKAAVDRLLHHAHVLITEGTSLRLAEATAGRGVVPLN